MWRHYSLSRNVRGTITTRTLIGVCVALFLLSRSILGATISFQEYMRRHYYFYGDIWAPFLHFRRIWAAIISFLGICGAQLVFSYRYVGSHCCLQYISAQLQSYLSRGVRGARFSLWKVMWHNFYLSWDLCRTICMYFSRGCPSVIRIFLGGSTWHHLYLSRSLWGDTNF